MKLVMSRRKKQTRQLKKLSSKGTDTEARWLKKGNRTIFGYKRHDGVDEKWDDTWCAYHNSQRA
jgi:hypothetical protein